MWKFGKHLASFLTRRIIPSWHESRRAVAVLGMAAVMGSCAASPQLPPTSDTGTHTRENAMQTVESPSEHVGDHDRAHVSSSTAPRQPFSLEERMSLGKTAERLAKDVPVKPLYSFRAQNMPLADALRLFSRVNELNIVVGSDVEGDVTVDFQGLSLDKAMAALLDTHGYYWEQQDELIVVRRMETRTFTLDYIRLERGGSGRNKAQVTSGSGGGSSGGQDAGEVSLTQQDQIKFWEELETQVKALLSEDGRLVVNRLSGTIQVTDLHKRIEEVSQFLVNIRQTLYRQVEIEARIYEVSLRDDYSLGLDWSRINFEGTAGNVALTNIITSAAGGFPVKAATAAISFADGSFSGVLEALHEQGQVKVVSQPRILTLNNQPALIKVGTDQSFFTSTVTQGVAGAGNIVTEQIRTVTSGLVLSVTPQISQDGWIMMDVSPIITTLTDTVTSANGSTAPVIDVKQSGGLVRVRDGEMVIIGGLIQDQLADTERKVPILGDLPGLGRIFKGTYQVKRKTELVIFLTARIVKVT